MFPAPTRKVASFGACSTRLRRLAKKRVAPGPASWRSIEPFRRQGEQPGDLHAGQVPAAGAVGKVDGSRERGFSLHLGTGKVKRGEVRAIDLQGQRDGIAGEPGQRADDDLLGGSPVEHAAGLAGDDLGREPAKPKGGLDSRLVDGLCKPGQVRVDRSLVDLRPRRDVAAEDADAETL